MFSAAAKEVIYQAISPIGLLASAQQVDNYARVWARDASMTGWLGYQLGDAKIRAAYVQSVLTLAQHQSPTGQIPSNVGSAGQVSYGTLVGRVDATTWWLISVGTLLGNADFAAAHQAALLPQIEKALSVLQAWELNGRGFIYTPLGGNWADEYVCSGYTLYDNCLRYWALQSLSAVLPALAPQAQALKAAIALNFGHQDDRLAECYHPEAFKRKMAHAKPYMSCSFSANGYDQRWDMAGNALALLLGIHTDVLGMASFIEALFEEFPQGMLPVFYPIIFPQDEDWRLLESNYLYHFKNQPYHFHNGGSWPIFLGWLCLALKNKGLPQLAQKITGAYEIQLQKECNFCEYYSGDTAEGLGTLNLCFSASGYLLMTEKINFTL